MGYLIGADIGSQSVKAVLLDPDGATIATAGQPHAMVHPASGWAEQDPALWRDGLAAAVRQVLATAGIGFAFFLKPRDPKKYESAGRLINEGL